MCHVCDETSVESGLKSSPPRLLHVTIAKFQVTRDPCSEIVTGVSGGIEGGGDGGGDGGGGDGAGEDGGGGVSGGVNGGTVGNGGIIGGDGGGGEGGGSIFLHTTLPFAGSNNP